jgi:RNA polymerase sigma-70 factor (ECF subfamily)
MTQPPSSFAGRELDLERYRHYLAALARAQVDPGLRDRVDLSGVVQQTFLEAYQKLRELNGATPEQLAGWLRKILAHNLADALRNLGAAKRNAARQRSLEAALEESSLRLGNWLTSSDQSSPSLNLQRQERAVQLADALATLPDAQREALVLRYWHDWPLARISAHLGRTPAAVAGLLKRGLKELRGTMREELGEMP